MPFSRIRNHTNIGRGTQTRVEDATSMRATMPNATNTDTDTTTAGCSLAYRVVRHSVTSPTTSTVPTLYTSRRTTLAHRKTQHGGSHEDKETTGDTNPWTTGWALSSRLARSEVWSSGKSYATRTESDKITSRAVTQKRCVWEHVQRVILEVLVVCYCHIPRDFSCVFVVSTWRIASQRKVKRFGCVKEINKNESIN